MKTRRPLSHLLCALALLLGAAGTAAAPPEPDPSEPAITIRHGLEDEVIYEYRLNGEIREIKVVPPRGKPYYLVPSKDNKGYVRLDKSSLLVPSWILFRW